jgi:hypothetical protein
LPLALVRIHRMTACVRATQARRFHAERQPSAAVDHCHTWWCSNWRCGEGTTTRPNSAMRPLLEIQQRWSVCGPRRRPQLVAEVLSAKAGIQYPFAGRPAHIQ